MSTAVQDYTQARATFSRDALIKAVLSGTLDRLNACIECCDRWADGDRIALEWFGVDDSHRQVSYADLAKRAARFANVLTARGIGPGDVVAVCCRAFPTCSRSFWAPGAPARSISRCSRHSGRRRSRAA